MKAHLTFVAFVGVLAFTGCPPAEEGAPAVVLTYPNDLGECPDGTICSFDFGAVGGSGDATFTLVNKGDGDGDIIDISLEGDPNITVDTKAAHIAAGASVPVVFSATPVAAGQITSSVSITWRSPEHVIHLTLTAGDTSAPHLSVDPVSCEFGSIVQGQQGSCTLTLTNTGNRDLTLASIDIVSGEDVFVVGAGIAAGTVLTPGTSTTAAVTATPIAPGGADGIARIQSDDPANAALFVTLTVESAPHLVLPPEGCDFGDVATGNLVTCDVVIGNDGAADLVLENISVGGDTNALGLTEAPPASLVISAGGSATITTATAPPDVGSFDGQLSFTTNDPTQPTGSVPLHVNGIAPP